MIRRMGLWLAFLVIGALSSSQASALLIGVQGSNSAGITATLNAGGHTATNFFGSPSAAQLAGLDAMFLVRAFGNADLQNFVLGGGLLITEWTGAAWALNTANLLNATDSGGGFVGTNTPVTFTPAGVAAGLSTGLGNPYAAFGTTEFFRTLTGIGAGVNILGTRPGNIPVILGGASGLGSTLIIGYDWQDQQFNGVLDSPSEQLVLNAVQFSATPIPEPSTLAMFGIGLAGLGLLGWRIRKRNRNKHTFGTRLAPA